MKPLLLQACNCGACSVNLCCQMLHKKGAESVCVVVNVDVTYLWLLALSVDNSVPGKPCCKKRL